LNDISVLQETNMLHHATPECTGLLRSCWESVHFVVAATTLLVQWSISFSKHQL